MRSKDFLEIPNKWFASYTPLAVSSHPQDNALIGSDKAGARNLKEVFAVIKSNVRFGQQAGFGMPMSWSAPVAIVRALPTSGAVLAAAGSKRGRVDATPVCGYRHITDAATVQGAFPGTSAWRPPIC